MDALKKLFSSEHGLLGLALIIAATVLVVVKAMTIQDWKDYTQVIFVATAGSSAVVAGVQAFRAPQQPAQLPQPATEEKKS